jgi:hypothetical protein
MYFFWSPCNRPPRAQRGRRGIALLILNLCARRWWVISTTPRPLYPRERPGTHLQEAGWALGPVWTCAKNLAPTVIFFYYTYINLGVLNRHRSPERPARTQSLYRLSYPALGYNVWCSETFGISF